MMNSCVRIGIALLLNILSMSLFAQELEIHVINVGWGQATFIKGPGPAGKTVLLEAGNTGKGTNEVVPYLQSIGHDTSAGFDYVIGGHQHCDHLGGLDEVINAGYDVRLKQYFNGSTYSSSCVDGWNSAAADTTAGTPVAMTPGTVIDLGDGATLTCVAAKGKIIGGGSVGVSNENDLSIALLLEYGGFDYFWASDLGGGADDGDCTGRSTSQLNVETPIMQAISPGGANPLISSGGIDVLHVSHHGSESSTNNDLMDYSVPAVAVISTGAGQSSNWNFPRIDVVDNVLLGQAACVTAPPTLVLQSEEGSPAGSLTSYSGYCVGDIKITTDGANLFTVSANGEVTQGPNEISAAALPQSFTLDDGAPASDTEAPSTSITAPAGGATVSGTALVTAGASDNIGVTKVEFYLDGALKSTDTTSPYEWNWDSTTTTNASHSLTSRAYDAANNTGTSAAVSVTVNNATPPAAGTDVSGYTLKQQNASLSYGIPAGTTIPSKGYVVIGRNATRAQFETFWGVTLGSDVVYVNSADRMPQINGDESYTLYNASKSRIDGRTVNMAESAGQSLKRTNGCGNASKAASWSRTSASTANPGSGAPVDCGKGIYISEFSDALGTGNYVYEFVELHNDK